MPINTQKLTWDELEMFDAQKLFAEMAFGVATT